MTKIIPPKRRSRSGPLTAGTEIIPPSPQLRLSAKARRIARLQDKLIRQSYERSDITRAFSGRYSDELRSLLSLDPKSLKESLQENTPTQNYANYLELIDVVKNASAQNASPNELIYEIVRLGDKAVKIAESTKPLSDLMRSEKFSISKRGAK